MNLLPFAMIYSVPTFFFIYAWFFMKATSSWNYRERGDARTCATVIIGLILIIHGVSMLTN